MQEKLGLPNGNVFKSASALAAGIGRAGETCGALTAGVLAIDLYVGRERIEDTAQLRASMGPARELYLAFQKEVGHTLCFEIQKLLYGREFRLYIPEDYKAFEEAGGHGPDGCPVVVYKATKLAADFVLRMQGR